MRGQMFSYDLLLAAVVLSSLLALFILTTSTVLGQIDDAQVRSVIGEDAQLAADSLVHTPGDPSNWESYPINETGVRSLGLANAPGDLSAGKVGRLMGVANTSDEYYATVQILGLTRQGYRYNASVEAMNGTTLYALQRFPPPGVVHASYAERLATLNGSMVKVKLVVWNE